MQILSPWIVFYQIIPAIFHLLTNFRQLLASNTVLFLWAYILCYDKVNMSCENILFYILKIYMFVQRLLFYSCMSDCGQNVILNTICFYNIKPISISRLKLILKLSRYKAYAQIEKRPQKLI